MDRVFVRNLIVFHLAGSLIGAIAVKAMGQSNRDWVYMGETNDRRTLYLDSKSIQGKPNAGNHRWFDYLIGNNKRTGSTFCKSGKTAKPTTWTVESISSPIQAIADSKASKKMLTEVCKRGF